MVCLSGCVFATVQADAGAKRPNIVFILADDMGYGDIRAYNPASKIPTPHLDGLAGEGMSFRDAHSPSAVCTPTRYGVLTGRYCWRTHLKRGVLGGYSAPLIKAERSTVATLLAANGYQTGAVGKWHLGMGMAKNEGKGVDVKNWSGDGNVDFSKPIADGPTTRGFGYYYGVSASFDMAPYVWIENDRFTSVPTKMFPGKPFPAFARKGPQADDVVFDEGLDVIAGKAADFIKSRAAGDKPYFLYLPLTGPHKPIVPHPRFVGKSGLGLYGDFIMNVDDTVGQVLKAIAASGEAEDTLVIYTSDNGSFMYRDDDPGAKGHVADPGTQAYRSDKHKANGVLRGTKADVWEAGHRVPFIVRWPTAVAAGSSCDETVCLTDFYATAAGLAGAKMGDDEGEDSFSLLPLFAGKAWERAPVINHSAAGMFAIRDGGWKLVAGNGSGGREKPSGKPFAKPYALFDLAKDLGEKTDVAGEKPEIVARLEKALTRIRESGRSR